MARQRRIGWQPLLELQVQLFLKYEELMSASFSVFLSLTTKIFCLAFEKRRSAPFDQLQISQQVQEISRPLYLTMSCFAALGLLFSVICLILNIVYRNRK